MSLVSRLSLVTGGGSGIGRAACQLLAREGASVAVAGNILSHTQETTEQLRDIAQSHGHKEALFRAFEVDVSSSKQVHSLFGSLSTSFSGSSPLSIVVNGAGITRDSLLLKQREEEFDEVIDVNLKGTFLVTQAAAKYMVENKVRNGSIINISSIVAKVGNIGQANYSASKGGVVSLTLTCAKELGRYGIRCNAVLPGFIDTQMTEHIPDKLKEAFMTAIALRRLGKPEEVAELCVFLASDKSSYISGSTIEISGGMGV